MILVVDTTRTYLFFFFHFYSIFMKGFITMQTKREMSERGAHAAPCSLEPWLELRDKVVMVTGASSGISRDLCIDLAKAGCRNVRRGSENRPLTIALPRDQRPSRLGKSRRAEPRTVKSRCRGARHQREGPAIEAVVNEAWDAFGTIDALINNAGVRGNFI